MAFCRRDEFCQLPLRLGKQGADAVEKPVDFAFPAEEDAAQHQSTALLGMGLGVGKRQGRPPGAAEHQPGVDAKFSPQRFHVCDQMRRGVVGEFTVRR